MGYTALWLVVWELLHVILDCDGIVISGSDPDQQAVIEALKPFHAFCAAGTLVDKRAWSSGNIEDPKLDQWLSQYDRDQVIFVSFGSMFFPATDKLKLLLGEHFL